MTVSQEQNEINVELKEWLRPVEDPDLGDSLLDLGLIYEVRFDEGKAEVDMTLTSPACPAADELVENVKKRILEHEKVKEAQVNIVWEPKWDPREMASDEIRERLGLW